MRGINDLYSMSSLTRTTSKKLGDFTELDTIYMTLYGAYNMVGKATDLN